MRDIKKLFQHANEQTQNGELQEALDSYGKIIDLSEESDRAFHIACWGIGEIYLNNQQLPDAISYLSKAVELAPEQGYYQYLLGCAFTYSENIDMALKHLEKAVELDDSFWEFWNQLGWVEGYNRDVDKGIGYLKRAISLNPKKAKSYRDLSMLYGQKREWKTALLVIDEAIAAEPDDEENYQIKEQFEHLVDGYNSLEDD